MTQSNGKPTMKKLYRSKNDRKISGVCGGIAQYFDIDPTIIRVGFVVISLPGFLHGILLYFILALVIPEQP